MIAGDQSFAREALRLVLERAGYDVVGEASDGVGAMQLLREQRPDLLVLAPHLRILKGLEVIRGSRRAFPSVKALVLSEVANASTCRAHIKTALTELSRVKLAGRPRAGGEDHRVGH